MYREGDQTISHTRGDGSMSASSTSSMSGQMAPYMDKIQQMVNRFQQNPEELKGLLNNKAVRAIGVALGLALLTGQIRRKR